ncbi:MAG: O-antigen ligase family protein [Kiritimatiellae bacterium]|nr:O-antigen ligase family protein [Kiritimatiellia bacterium]
MRFVHVFAFSLLCVLILFLAVWGAGVFPLSVCIVASATCITVALCLIISRRQNDNALPRMNIPLVAALAMLAIVLLAVSVIPLPSRLDAASGLRRYSQNDSVRETLSEAARLNIIKKSSFHFSITRNRSGTLRILLLAIIMFNSAILTALLPSKMRSTLLCFLIGLVAVISATGFFHQWIFPKEKTIWWIFNVPHGNPVGCFVNRTHHAGFIAMIMPVALAMFIEAITNKRILYALFCGILFFVMAFGVLASLARGAILAACVGTVMVLVLTAFRRRMIAIISLCILLSVAVGGMFAVISSPTDDSSINNMQSHVTARLGTLTDPMSTFSGQARVSVWKDSFRIWKDYAILGTGANGFRMMFPQYRTRTDRKSFVSAESEYLELLTDTGLIGVILMGLIAWAALKQWRFNLRDGNISPHIGVAVAGAATVVFVHNMVDTPMHTPLYAMVFAALAGLGLSVPRLKNKPLFPFTLNAPRHLTAGILMVAGLCICISLMICGTRVYTRDISDFATTSDPDELATTLVWAPTSWMAWCYFGRSLFQCQNREAYILGEKCISRATEYDRRNYRLWETLGYTRASMGDKEGAQMAFARMHALRPWKKSPDLNVDRY